MASTSLMDLKVLKQTVIFSTTFSILEPKQTGNQKKTFCLKAKQMRLVILTNHMERYVHRRQL